jgi:cullin 1
VGLQSATEATDEDLLKYYTAEWKQFTIASGYINRVFDYLNRHWVKRERDEGHKDVYDVYTVGGIAAHDICTHVLTTRTLVSIGDLERMSFQANSLQNYWICAAVSRKTKKWRHNRYELDKGCCGFLWSDKVDGDVCCITHLFLCSLLGVGR